MTPEQIKEQIEAIREGTTQLLKDKEAALKVFDKLGFTEPADTGKKRKKKKMN